MESKTAPVENIDNLQKDVTDLKDKCPAFEEKCPFDTPAAKELKELAKDCPAFKEGCVFENAKTIQDVYEQLSNIPDMANGSPHQKALVMILKLIHSVSSELKEKIGECPAFSSKQGCPFKTVCSDGKPMVEKLTDFNTESLVYESVIQVKEELDEEMAAKDEKDDGKPESDQPTKEAPKDGISLAKEMKKGTMKYHRRAQNVHFIKNLVKGKVEERIYREAVSSLYFLYSTLEEEIEKNADNPLIKHIHMPKELARVESLKKDLEYYYGDDWADAISTTDSLQKYIDYLHELSEKNPSLLVAHHYTRYLGDLSGGEIMKKMLVKTYQLPENGDGVHFFDFKNIEDPIAFKNVYRSRLDGMGIDREMADKLVEESKVAYVMNIDFFKELDKLAGFEEEIIHDEVEIDDEKEAEPETVGYGQPANEVAEKKTESQSTGGKSAHVTNTSDVDIMKVIAAVVIAIAVIVAVAMNLMAKE